MKKNVWKLPLLLAALLSLAACSNDDDTKSITDSNATSTTNYAYIVNNGNWNANDGAVMSLNMSDKSWVMKDIYKACNGKGIGDAQDLAIADGQLFVTSTTGDKVEVLKMDGEIIKTVPMKNRSPRYIIADGNEVYFTAYSGYVYRMNASNYTVDDSVQVGDHPEALAVADGKIYVANSGYGTGNTVSVIDEASFKKTKDIQVALDPYNQMIAVGSKVFLISDLDFTDNLLQVIDVATGKVTSLTSASTRYDLSTGKTTSLSGLSIVKDPGQVSVDPSTGQIYVVDNESYSAPCSIYVFDSNGNKLRTLTNVGYGTEQVVFNPNGKVN
jgi:YVTN family beta-propeller protein